MKFYECEESANLCTARPLLCFIKQKSRQQIYHFLKMAHLVPTVDKDSECTGHKTLKVKTRQQSNPQQLERWRGNSPQSLSYEAAENKPLFKCCTSKISFFTSDKNINESLNKHCHSHTGSSKAISTLLYSQDKVSMGPTLLNSKPHILSPHIKLTTKISSTTHWKKNTKCWAVSLLPHLFMLCNAHVKSKFD